MMTCLLDVGAGRMVEAILPIMFIFIAAVIVCMIIGIVLVVKAADTNRKKIEEMAKADELAEANAETEEFIENIKKANGENGQV